MYVVPKKKQLKFLARDVLSRLSRNLFSWHLMIFDGNRKADYPIWLILLLKTKWVQLILE